MAATKVFIPHDELVWVSGEIVSDTKNGSVEVKITDRELPADRGTKIINLQKYKLSSLPLQNTELAELGVDDMCSLSYLHEPSILDNLKRRFFSKKPYTYTGEICIAVNPYCWFDIYSKENRSLYAHAFKHERAPHVYASSAAAYRGLVTRNLNQCILVSGESGAGKTETVKILMSHLAHIAGKHDDKIVDKLLKANPLLESFGNAKTARNDNSSRFGKFSQLEFDSHHMLVGSKCITYLLEKSRVVSQNNSKERNYHIIYELLSSSPETREKLFLSQRHLAQNFYYTEGGDIKTNEIERVKDSERYKYTIEALTLLGISAETRFLIESIIAGILHLGQINFVAKDGTTHGEDGVKLDSDELTEFSLEACCTLLGLQPAYFMSTIVCRSLDVEGKKLQVPLSLDQATTGRDALAKEMYARLFQWLVLVINFSTSHTANNNNNFGDDGGLNSLESSPSSRSLRSSPPRNNNNSSGSNSSGLSTISLLDIFGFESFQINRFEQLCINYANEKLQQKFALDVFKTVQKEYQDEGIHWELINYKDNADTLELIEGKQESILGILNEECLMPKGNDLNFLAKIVKKHTNHISFSVERLKREEFNIHHYAGVVSYTVTGFLDRNKDTLPNNMSEMLTTSSNTLLRRMFAHTAFFRGESQDVDRLLAGDRNQNALFLLLTSDDTNADSLSSVSQLKSPVQNNNNNTGKSLDNPYGVLPLSRSRRSLSTASSDAKENNMNGMNNGGGNNSYSYTSNSTNSNGVASSDSSTIPFIYDECFPSIGELPNSSGGSGGGDRDSFSGGNFRESFSGSASFKGGNGGNSSPFTSGKANLRTSFSRRRNDSGSFSNNVFGGSGGGGGVLSESVTAKFQYQLASLMEMISVTEVQYVRCIKPNSNKSNKEFSRALVVEQLRSAGMIEAVRISRSAYPNRLPYPEFHDRYRFLKSQAWLTKAKGSTYNDDYHGSVIQVVKALLLNLVLQFRKEPTATGTNLTVKANTKSAGTSATTATSKSSVSTTAVVKNSAPVITGTNEESFQFGHTKVYFSSILLEHLEIKRTQCMYNYVVSIQAVIRGYLLHQRYKLKKKSSIQIQSIIRRFNQQCRFIRLLAIHRKLVRSVTSLQSLQRSKAPRIQFLRVKKAVTKIASIARMKRHCSKYIIYRDAYRQANDAEAAQRAYDLAMQEEKEVFRREIAKREEEQRRQEEIMIQQKLENEKRLQEAQGAAQAELIRQENQLKLELQLQYETERKRQEEESERLKQQLLQEQESLLAQKLLEKESLHAQEKLIQEDSMKQSVEALKSSFLQREAELSQQHASELQLALLNENIKIVNQYELQMTEALESLQKKHEEELQLYEQHRISSDEEVEKIKSFLQLKDQETTQLVSTHAAKEVSMRQEWEVKMTSTIQQKLDQQAKEFQHQQELLVAKHTEQLKHSIAIEKSVTEEVRSTLQAKLEAVEFQSKALQMKLQDKRKLHKEEINKKDVDLKEIVLRHHQQLDSRDVQAKAALDEERQRFATFMQQHQEQSEKVLSRGLLETPILLQKKEEELSFMKYQYQSAVDKEIETKKMIEDERERNRQDNIRRDEVTLSLNQSFQSQIEIAQQREREALLTLEKEKEKSQLLITKLKSDIRDALTQHQELLTVHEKQSKEEMERIKEASRAEIVRLEVQLLKQQSEYRAFQVSSEKENKLQSQSFQQQLQEMKEKYDVYKQEMLQEFSVSSKKESERQVEHLKYKESTLMDLRNAHVKLEEKLRKAITREKYLTTIEVYSVVTISSVVGLVLYFFSYEFSVLIALKTILSFMK